MCSRLAVDVSVCSRVATVTCKLKCELKSKGELRCHEKVKADEVSVREGDWLITRWKQLKQRRQRSFTWGPAGCCRMSGYQRASVALAVRCVPHCRHLSAVLAVIQSMEHVEFSVPPYFLPLPLCQCQRFYQTGSEVSVLIKWWTKKPCFVNDE